MSPEEPAPESRPVGVPRAAPGWRFGDDTSGLELAALEVVGVDGTNERAETSASSLRPHAG